jgi:hypothetical protein
VEHLWPLRVRIMIDDIETLKARWQESHNTADDKAYLCALVRTGRLSQERIQFAAGLAHNGACATELGRTQMPQHHRSMIMQVVNALAHPEAVSFGLDCAVRAIQRWEALFPRDRRPREAIELTRLWLLDKASADELAFAAKRASDAARGADDPDKVPDDRELTAAIQAADSASHAALAAENGARYALGQEMSIGGIEDCVGFAASFAVKAATDAVNEIKWQTEQLVCYLLGRAKPLWFKP